jgi:AraC-like DNA-binding protein
MTRSPVIASATVSVQGVWLLAAGAQARGLDVPALLGRHGLAHSLGADVDARVPATAVLALWAELPELTGLPHFGVWLAELACAAPATSLGAKLVHSAPTLGVGLGRLVAFERVFHGVAATTLALDGEIARFTHRPPIGIGPGAAPAIELAFAWILGTARVTTGHAITASAISFRHAAPGAESLAEHRRFFGVTPRFSGPENTLELPREALSLPQRTADALLERLVERHARGLSNELPTDAGLCARIRSLVKTALLRGDVGECTLAACAAKLVLPPRTLQRKLAAEGSSFASLLDEARRELSLELLAEPSTSVAEVAFALGFGDQTAFHRAFVRWTGSTPGEHKKRLRQAAPAAPS